MGALKDTSANRGRGDEPIKRTFAVNRTELSSGTATTTTDDSIVNQAQPLFRQQQSPVAPAESLKRKQQLQSSRSSRRLTNLKSFFRFRKSRQPDLPLNPVLELPTRPENTRNLASGCMLSRCIVEGYCAESTSNPHGSGQPDEAGEARKVSDNTMYSLHSDQTSATVCHDPSKRLSMPIALADPSLCRNPFTDPLNLVDDSESSRNHARNPTRTTRQSSSESSQTGVSSTYDDTESFQRLANPFAGGSSIESRSSSRDSFYVSTSDDSSVIAEIERRAAVLEFNELVQKLRLPPLPMNNSKGAESGDGSHSQLPGQPPPTTTGEKVSSGRRDRLYGRLRTMRSTLQLGHSSEGPRTTRTLRRMKTLAHVGTRVNEMTSLTGMSLEELARLGGYNLLTLPAEFAPMKLRLPVCFVTTITFLGRFAAPVRDVFVDPGHPKMAMRIYDHFAQSVLAALRQPDRIQMTVGRSDLPLAVIEPSARTMDDTMVQSMARAFLALLAGLPGRLLGLPALYRVLVGISQAPVVGDEVERRRSCLGGVSPQDYVKVKAIGLALLALTNTMQLHLLCGVIGLGALLLHETQRLAQEEAPRSVNKENGRRTSGEPGPLTLDRLGRVLGPLLTGREGSGDTLGAIVQEIESERVVMMLVEHWRGISRQLRIWEHRNLPRRRRRSVQMGRAMVC
ncbi:hypothetical protein ASPACDRAFT_41919 [Aspergillus aculeatus ATCC 16872]|uniref:Rho-GAP domain-containing protein n=1 Tax=Aspergillus aculeatus (strain ATCC 16872 / CBS 172.66 / WB 5094) TaxID=690307 RepID=A0A1L9X0J8_ASPA1|nr:uncharacterized protein ASPACDRAFT_41919 [Aspergillus aculeatus ATCC 16872]OJK01658.1 hypothetical protein ASPACDRAFT_41919 [Aspergillus aculeatus ATCC 16872]